jgi:hypothetical protein
MQVLNEWGRYDRAPATQRLQLLLSEIAASPKYTLRVHELAGCNTIKASATPCSNIATNNQPASISGAGALLAKGVPHGTPRMPASDRITVEVLKHKPCEEV